MNRSILNVLYLTDDNYATYAGISIYSLFENNQDIDEIHVYVINDNISNSQQHKMKELANSYNRELSFLNMNDSIEILRENNIPTYRGSYTTYLKLFAFSILPESVHNIFFIDSDTIVTGSLKEICNYNMKENNIAAAVRDGLCASYKMALGYPKSDSWFNMGVVLIDTYAWKREKMTEQVVKLLHKRRAFIAVDQDILNILLHGRIETLNPKYNATAHHYVYKAKAFLRAFPQEGFYDANTLDNGNRNAIIRHFERFLGESAWDKDSIHPYAPLFKEYQIKSPWKDYRYTYTRNNQMIFRIERIFYKTLPHDFFVYIFGIGFRHYLSNTNKLLLSNEETSNIE